MGLYVRLSILPDRIDEERWEALWLTSLQLLERFPGPLAVHRIDERRESRIVWSPRLLFQVGTPDEHWRVEGDLGSNRFAETYRLQRHLSRYRPRARQPADGAAADILWMPAGELQSGGVAGVDVFDAKSQG